MAKLPRHSPPSAVITALADGRAPLLELLRLNDTGLDDEAVQILVAGIRSGQLPQLHALECRSNPQVGEQAKDELRAATEATIARMVAPTRTGAIQKCHTTASMLKSVGVPVAQAAVRCGLAGECRRRPPVTGRVCQSSSTLPRIKLKMLLPVRQPWHPPF